MKVFCRVFGHSWVAQVGMSGDEYAWCQRCDHMERVVVCHLCGGRGMKSLFGGAHLHHKDGHIWQYYCNDGDACNKRRLALCE